MSNLLREQIMGRPASSNPDGKRSFEVKVYLTEAMYDDLVAFAHVAKKTKSEVASDLLHVSLYGLCGFGAESSRRVDADGRPTIRPDESP
jgi:hypothetical protein